MNSALDIYFRLEIGGVQIEHKTAIKARPLYCHCTALASCKSVTHFSKKGLVLKISAVDSFSNPEVLGVIDNLLEAEIRL